MKNQLKIGMLLGTGIELGIGILAQPGMSKISTRSITNSVKLPLFRKFEVSPPFDPYYTALYKAFCEAFPGIS